jgi:O-antigen/teichoic acid export membrane protein
LGNIVRISNLKSGLGKTNRIDEHTQDHRHNMSTVPKLSSPVSLTQSQRDRTLISGVAWTGAVKWIAQALSWGSTIVVARLLSPDDYGIVGMATVYIGLVAMINEFGIGAAVVAHHNLDRNQVTQINSLAALVGGLCMVLSWAAAVPIARFYGTAQLQWVIIVMSLTFVTYSIRSVPQAIMARELEFKILAKIEGLQVTIQAVSTVVLALLGMRYWALIVGNILGTTVASVLSCVARPQRFAFPQVRSIQEAITFSQQVVVTRIAWYVQSNSDFLVAGRLLGKTALGYYTFAWTLASLPVDKVTTLINQVTFPLFSSVQSDHYALRRYLLKLTEALSLITFPLACGLAAEARGAVLVVLGEKWMGVVVPLQILAISSTLRSIAPLVSQILLVSGESRFLMKLSVVAAILLPTAFFVGSRWGTMGIALAWLLIHPFLVLALCRKAFQKIGISAWQYLHSLWPALSATSLMILVLHLIKSLPSPGLNPAFLLGIDVLCGAAAYVGSLALFCRGRLFSFFQLLRTINSVPTEGSQNI